MGFRNRRQVVAALAAVPVGLLAACQTAPPTPAKPAAAAVTDKLFLMVDVIQGSKNIPAEQAKLRSCTLSSRFPRNSEMVWRARVFDPKTGDVMDNKALKGVEVRLASGKNFEADWGAHPKDPPNEFYWTASWVVPKDQPTGSMKFSVVANAADGRTGTFEPFGVVPALPTILDDVYPDAPAAPASPAPAKPKA